MEEIRRRLQVTNSAIKQQTIKKLQEQIEKQTADGVLNDRTNQSVELRLVWERCGDGDLIVSSSVCQALVELVRSGRADFHYILSGLLSALPTARCLVGIVKGVCELLVLQLLVINSTGQAYSSPYSIRHPPHPFITVLTSRPDSWLLLQHQVQRIISWPSHLVRERALTVLAPYLKFVLLEPVQSPQFTQCRLSLLPTCLKTAAKDEETQAKAVAFFLDILPCLQIKTAAGLGDTTHFLVTLVSFLTSEGRSIALRGSQQEDTAQRLVMQMISLSSVASREGTADPIIFIDIIEDLIKVYPQAVRGPGVVVSAVEMLLEAPSYCQLRLLHLVRRHLSVCQLSGGCSVHNLLYYPLLNLITSSDPFCEDDSQQIQTLTADILSQLEASAGVASQKEKEARNEDATVLGESLKLSPGECDTSYMVRLCGLFERCPTSQHVTDYLLRLEASLKRLGVGRLVVPLVVGVFCSSTQRAHKLTAACLLLLQTIATKLPEQSLNLLPVLLYKMNKVTSPQLKLHILNTLPKLATHKISMSPILRTLQLIGGSPKLKALSIRLMTSLWKHQDRCFPYLQQELMERHYSTNATGGLNEVMLAKAASMRDICQLRPHQHGEDLVEPMSSLLNQCDADVDAPVVSLILEALYYLCQEEVIDIKTTWAVLAGKLKQDNRPLVVQGLCRLFSLVPALAEGREEEFKSFRKEVVSILWHYVTDPGSKDRELVVNAAYSSLAKYRPDDFHISHLPKQVSQDLIAAALAEYPEEFEVDESCLPHITGDCYTNMLKQMPPSHLPGFEELLTSLVHTEVKDMPRGIHHSANRRQTASANQNKALAAVPQFLHSEYEQNKQPGLRQGLAAGLLFGYDPSLPVGRDGKPRKQHLVKFGKQYYQMLYTLINEVSIQPTDWRRTLVTSQAWTAFMDRCYPAYIECRKAELELQVQQGEARNLEENQLMQDTAWLWARDKLTDLIKSCSKGSPTSQGNSLSALVGLAVAATKHLSGLCEETRARSQETPEHLGHAHWLQMGANTLLAVMEYSYQPLGRIFAMCQQKSRSDRTPASLLARSAASVSLSQLLPALIPVNADLVYPVLTLLSQRLAGGGGDQGEEPGVIQWFYGLALGQALAALFQENFLEVSGVQGMLAVWKAVDALEASVFSSSDNRLGSVLGLGVCLSAMCKDGKPDTKVRLSRLQQQLSDGVQQAESVDNTVYEGLCVSLAYVTASAYASNILTQDTVDRTVAMIYTAHMNHPHVVGAAVALGAVCCGLLQAGHPTVRDLLDKLYSTWLSQIQDTCEIALEAACYHVLQDDPMVGLAAVQGAVAIAGPDNCIMQIPSSGSSQHTIQTGDLVKTVTQTFGSSSDLGLQVCVPWLLGHLYMASCNVNTESNTTVPSTYHYLPESSVLRACADLLVEAGRAGPELLSPHTVLAALNALNQGATQALPPLNWPSILSPIMRMSFGPSVERGCVCLSVKQSGSSPSTAMFLTTWLLAPLYDSLGSQSKDHLFDSLPLLIKSVPPVKLELHLKEALVSLFDPSGDWRQQTESNSSRCERALSGLCKALAVHDPPQSVTTVLYSALNQVYMATARQNNHTLLESVCQCFKELPDAEVDKITNSTLEDADRVLGVLSTRCYLVGEGSQPLAWLNQAIELLLVADKSRQMEAAAVLCHCLILTDQCQSELCHVSPRMQWLLELMGYIKGLLTNSSEEQNSNLTEILDFLLHIFACAVVAWSSHPSKSVLAIKYYCSTHQSSSETTTCKDTQDSIDGEATEKGFNSVELWGLVELVFPSCLCALLGTEPWRQLTVKIIDWLIHIVGSEALHKVPDLRSHLKNCLYLLRHSKDFQKMNTWSRAFSIPT